jgi:hypothetical protein
MHRQMHDRQRHTAAKKQRIRQSPRTDLTRGMAPTVAELSHTVRLCAKLEEGTHLKIRCNGHSPDTGHHHHHHHHRQRPCRTACQRGQKYRDKLPCKHVLKRQAPSFGSGHGVPFGLDTRSGHVRSKPLQTALSLHAEPDAQSVPWSLGRISQLFVTWLQKAFSQGCGLSEGGQSSSLKHVAESIIFTCEQMIMKTIETIVKIN